MIQMLRVDHRLLHGQVAVAWFHELDINTILIANDEVAKDDLRKSAERLAKPERCKLVMKSVDDSIKTINSGITDKYKILILTESVADASKVVDGTGDAVKSVNLGGTIKRPGTKPYGKAVNLTDDEVKQLNKLQDQGVEVFVQMVPNDHKDELGRK